MARETTSSTDMASGQTVLSQASRGVPGPLAPMRPAPALCENTRNPAEGPPVPPGAPRTSTFSAFLARPNRALGRGATPTTMIPTSSNQQRNPASLWNAGASAGGPAHTRLCRRCPVLRYDMGPTRNPSMTQCDFSGRKRPLVDASQVYWDSARPDSVPDWGACM